MISTSLLINDQEQPESTSVTSCQIGPRLPVIPNFICSREETGTIVYSPVLFPGQVCARWPIEWHQKQLFSQCRPHSCTLLPSLDVVAIWWLKQSCVRWFDPLQHVTLVRGPTRMSRLSPCRHLGSPGHTLASGQRTAHLLSMMCRGVVWPGLVVQPQTRTRVCSSCSPLQTTLQVFVTLPEKCWGICHVGSGALWIANMLQNHLSQTSHIFILSASTLSSLNYW